jgi:hypothetical protein
MWGVRSIRDAAYGLRHHHHTIFVSFVSRPPSDPKLLRASPKGRDTVANSKKTILGAQCSWQRFLRIAVALNDHVVPQSRQSNTPYTRTRDVATRTDERQRDDPRRSPDEHLIDPSIITHKPAKTGQSVCVMIVRQGTECRARAFDSQRRR